MKNKFKGFFEICRNINYFLNNEENLYLNNKTNVQEFLLKKDLIQETTSLIKKEPYLINNYRFTDLGFLIYKLTKPVRYFL